MIEVLAIAKKIVMLAANELIVVVSDEVLYLDVLHQQVVEDAISLVDTLLHDWRGR